MGIALHLHIAPERISQDDWKKVYEESLILLDAYPFLDKYIGQLDNGRNYFYGARTRERDDINGKYRGWRSTGDMWTGYNTEEFKMLADIADYLPDGPDDGGDILGCLFYNDEDFPEIKMPNGDALCSVFYAKTQGEDSHLYLLAIACLVAHRLPEAAVVCGDINAGQCRAAVEWANQYLSDPIDVPVQCDARRLLQRIMGMEGAQKLLEDGRILDLFFCMSLENRDAKMGEAIREQIPEETVKVYYRKKFREAGSETVLESKAKEYLELGFDLRQLAQLLVTEPDGQKMQPGEFFEMLFDMQIHVDDKMTYDMTIGDKDNPRPDDVGMLFARAFGMMAGCGNRNVDAYYPLSRISEICREVMGDICDIEQEIEDALKRITERKEHGDSPEDEIQNLFYGEDSTFAQLVEKERERTEEAKRYAIKSMDEIVYFEVGDTIEPGVEKTLRGCFEKLHTFLDGYDDFVKLNREGREGYLIRRNRNILIHESTWEHIFARIMDDEHMKRFYAVFRVDTSKQKIYDLIEAILINLDLLDYFWDDTSSRE